MGSLHLAHETNTDLEQSRYLSEKDNALQFFTVAREGENIQNMFYKMENLFHLKNLYQHIESANVHFLNMRNWNHHTGKIQSQWPESRNTYLGVKHFKYLYLKKFVLFKIDKSISLPTINWEQNFWTQVRLNTFEMTESPNMHLIQQSLQNTPQRAKFVPNGPHSVEHVHLLQKQLCWELYACYMVLSTCG